jgi:hypothetical protein
MDLNQKAQAVVLDALFFLTICGIASASLLWASSVYGNNSFDAYTFMYISDYEASLLNTMSENSYSVGASKRYWLDEMGYYMAGEFDRTHPRYEELMKQWHLMCLHSPHPLEATFFVESMSKPILHRKVVLSCPLNITDVGGYNVSGWVVDYLKGLCPPDPVTGKPTECNPGNTVYKNYTCPEGGTDVILCESPPPYYSSGEQRKLCGPYVCLMEAKLYY